MDLLIAGFLVLVGLGMWWMEFRRPRQALPHVATWRRRAVALSVIQVALAYLGTRLLDPWLQAHQWFQAHGMGPVWGTAWGYLAVTFLWYWWHRARHKVPWLWRTLHQVHHSPQRLELLTTYYKHPLESATNVVLGGVVIVLILGLTPLQAAGVTMLCGISEFIYHWNVPTPRWLGYLVQRPESHCIHHQAGQHANNYADLPVWDMLFGTFENPHHDDVVCGFGENEQRLGEMLAFSEVES